MPPEPISLSPARKLKTLRALDIFHRWESIDEERLCRRCGEIITGRAIKVYPGRRGGPQFRLECPTEGCASVPIEWDMIEPALAATAEPATATGPRPAPRSRFSWLRRRAASG